MDWRIYFTGSEELSAACGLAEGLWDCWCHGGLPGKGFPDGGCEVSGDVNDLDTIREVKTLPMECAVAVTVINSPSERDIIIGAGCDWWFEARLNGVCIHSTMESGNVFMDDDIGITNHAVRGRLNAGSNLLLMILRRGNGFSWRFAAAELPPMPAGMTPDDFERLYGKRGRRILCGPYLQAKAGGRLAVCVHLDRPLTAALQWREKGGAWSREIWGESVAWEKPVSRFHSILLPELAAGREYEYRIVTRTAMWQEEEISPAAAVPLQPLDGEHTLFLTSDLQVPVRRRQKIIRGFHENCGAGNAELFCSLGDIGSFFTDFRKEYFDGLVSPMLESGGAERIWIPGRGNHENRGPDSGAWAQYIGDTFFDFYYGDTAYLVLDCGEDKRNPDKDWHFYTRRVEFDQLFKAQRCWLNKVVHSERFRRAKRRIVLCHCTPFEVNSDFEEFHEHFMARNIRSVVGDYFFAPNPPFKIDLWISGHTHKSCRFDPRDNSFSSFPGDFRYRLYPGEEGRYPFPVLITDGPGRQGPDSPSGVMIKVGSEKLEITARMPDGSLVDHFTIGNDGGITVIETALSGI